MGSRLRIGRRAYACDGPPTAPIRSSCSTTLRDRLALGRSPWAPRGLLVDELFKTQVGRPISQRLLFGAVCILPLSTRRTVFLIDEARNTADPVRYAGRNRKRCWTVRGPRWISRARLVPSEDFQVLGKTGRRYG